MSREIRFRFWDTEEGKWLGKESSYWKELTFEDCRKKLIASMRQGNIVAEQYTGLKDKNGDKEIYEGDIVKYKLYADSRLDYIDEVFYSTISGAFMVGDEDNIRTLDCLINVEVIGNVHENKELLGGKK